MWAPFWPPARWALVRGPVSSFLAPIGSYSDPCMKTTSWAPFGIRPGPFRGPLSPCLAPIGSRSSPLCENAIAPHHPTQPNPSHLLRSIPCAVLVVLCLSGGGGRRGARTGQHHACMPHRDGGTECPPSLWGNGVFVLCVGFVVVMSRPCAACHERFVAQSFEGCRGVASGPRRGIGVSPEFQARIFEPFEQEEKNEMRSASPGGEAEQRPPVGARSRAMRDPNAGDDSPPLSRVAVHIRASSAHLR